MRVGVYRVSKQLWFCAAHQVRLSEDRCENLHGHNYRLLVHAEATRLDRTSYVLDFARLKKTAVAAAARFDHGNINEIEPFQEGGATPPPKSWPGSSARSLLASWTTTASASAAWRSSRSRTTAPSTCRDRGRRSGLRLRRQSHRPTGRSTRRPRQVVGD